MSDLVSVSKIEGLGPRLLNFANRIAPGAGTLAGTLGPIMSKGGGSFEGGIDAAGRAVKEFGFASPLKTTLSALRKSDVYPVKDGVITWVGGLVANELGKAIGGTAGGLLETGGDATMKFGGAQAGSSLIVSYFLEQGAVGARGLLKNVNVGGGGGSSTDGRDGRSMIRADNPEVQGTSLPRSGRTTITSGNPF